MRMCVCFWPLSYTRPQYRQVLLPLISRLAVLTISDICIATCSRNHSVARTMIVIVASGAAAQHTFQVFGFAKPKTKNQPCGARAGQVLGRTL